MLMHYTYILQSMLDGSYYVGSTGNLKDRLVAHNSRTVQSTKAKVPYKIVWYCAFENKTKSIAFEKYLKTGSCIAFANKHLRETRPFKSPHLH